MVDPNNRTPTRIVPTRSQTSSRPERSGGSEPREDLVEADARSDARGGEEGEGVPTRLEVVERPEAPRQVAPAEPRRQEPGEPRRGHAVATPQDDQAHDRQGDEDHLHRPVGPDDRRDPPEDRLGMHEGHVARTPRRRQPEPREQPEGVRGQDDRDHPQEPEMPRRRQRPAPSPGPWSRGDPVRRDHGGDDQHRASRVDQEDRRGRYDRPQPAPEPTPSQVGRDRPGRHQAQGYGEPV